LSIVNILKFINFNKSNSIVKPNFRIDKKGMDDAQQTGATSSYARKYALNGLFGIDDTKDADATNTHGNESKPEIPQFPKPRIGNALI